MGRRGHEESRTGNGRQPTLEELVQETVESYQNAQRVQSPQPDRASAPQSQHRPISQAMLAEWPGTGGGRGENYMTGYSDELSNGPRPDSSSAYGNNSSYGRYMSALENQRRRDHELQLAQLAGQGFGVPTAFNGVEGVGLQVPYPAHPHSSKPPTNPEMQVLAPTKERKRWSLRTKVWIGATVVSVASTGALSVWRQASCQSATDTGTQQHCLAVGTFNNVRLKNTPGTGEVIRGIDATTGWVVPKDEKQELGNANTPGKTTSTAPDSATDQQQPSPDNQPRKGERAPDLEKAVLDEVFPDGNAVSLGNITITNPKGQVTVTYGTKSGKIGISTERTVNFMAAPLKAAQAEQNGKKVTTFAPTNPFTVERLPNGELKLTYDRAKVLGLMGLEDEGSYAVTGDAKSGMKVTRKSSSGTSTISFTKPLKGNDIASGNVNIFVAPTTEKGASTAAEFAYVKDAIRQMGELEKCMDPSTNAPLPTKAILSKRLDDYTLQKLTSWTKDVMKTKAEVRLSGEYPLDGASVLNQSVAYTQTNGTPAAKAFASKILLAQTQIESADALKASGNLECRQQ